MADFETIKAKLNIDMGYPDRRPDVEPSALTEWRNNQYFLDNSHANYRFNSELVYVHYDFNRINDDIKGTFPTSILKDVTMDYKGNDWGAYLGKLFTINTLDISIPGQSQTFTSQNIMNKIKSYSTGLDTGTKNMAKFKVIESNNMHISRFINHILYLNHSPDKHRLGIYPDTLKFNVYVFPLIYDADKGGIYTFSTKKAAIILDGCQFIGFNDWDFDIRKIRNVVRRNIKRRKIE